MEYRDDRTCSNCYYFDDVSLICCKNSPKPIPLPLDDDNKDCKYSYLVLWPSTLAKKDWCGDYKPL